MERAELTDFVGTLGCAIVRSGFVFLGDPGWSRGERQAAEEQMGRAAEASGGSGWLCIRTGGSGGRVKFARHDERTLGAAVRGFCAHFAMSRVNSVGVLPPWHVSGLMARLRCAATGGRHIDCAWRELQAGNLPKVDDGSEWVISLVPTQLQRLLASHGTADWLRRFRILLLGGGPVWPDLADAAAGAGLPVSITYGLTETAAMVAALRPPDFIAGDRSSGPMMPHAVARIDANGRICIAGESVFRGYFPEFIESREIVTEDLGRIDERGRLHVLGRRDSVIITGGRKVVPEEVERALRNSGEFDDVAVVGVPDPEWGEAVVACYPAADRKPDLVRAVASLAAHQRPKRFVGIPDWPRTAHGKINRAALVNRVSEYRGGA